MITISSKAGQRMAKADAALEAAEEALRNLLADAKDPAAYLERLRSPEEGACMAAMAEWEAAAKALADELRDGGHHEAEGG
nr:hypothetical protein [Halomonas sp.]